MWSWFRNLFGKSDDCEACGNNPIIPQPQPLWGAPDRKCPKPAAWPPPPHIEALAKAGAVPALLRHAMECAGRCPMCYGNDGDMPCAYPSAKAQGCLRDKRLAREALEGRIAAAVAARRPPSPPPKRRAGESSAPNRSRSNDSGETALGVSLASLSSVAQTPTYTGGGGLSGGAGASGGWDSPDTKAD